MSLENTLDRDLFILGDPIETQFGEIRFLTYVEYLKNLSDLSRVSMNVLNYYYEYKKFATTIPSQNRKDFLDSLENLKKLSLYEFVLSDNHISASYLRVFKLVLAEKNHDRLEEVFDSEELFMGLRQLVMEMNFLTEDPTSENPEIQEYYDERKKQKQRESGKQSISDIVTSIVAGTSNSFEDVKNWTVIQLYSIYYRLGAFKNYDSSTLFATVSSDIKIESWSKNIDLFEKEELGINYEDFNKKYGGLFD